MAHRRQEELASLVLLRILVATVSSNPTREFFHSVIELGRREIRPQDIGDIKLCVRGLPQQVIRQSHFAARANHELRVWNVSGVQVRTNQRIIDLLSGDFLCHHIFRNLLDGFGELKARTIIEGNLQLQPSVVFSSLGRLFELLSKFGRDLGEIPQEGESNVVLSNLVEFLGEHTRKKIEEVFNLVFAAMPVFAGKGINREKFELTLTGMGGRYS